MVDLEVASRTETVADGPAISIEEILRRSQAALADRRARDEIMTYRLDGWMVREFPGQRIVRLCAEGDFRAADWPLPECRG